MPRRTRRSLAAACGLLLIPALAACGSKSSDATDQSSDGASSGSSSDASSSSSSGTSSGSTLASAVTFSGVVGHSLTATWHAPIGSSVPTTAMTLQKGTGAKVASGDTVTAFVYIGDGTTQKDAYSDFTKGTPESLPDSSQLGAAFTKVFANATYGSRVAVVTTPTELFGASAASGVSQLGIGASDKLVLVVDLVKKMAQAPTPSDDKVHQVAPSKLPSVISKKGEPVGLNFKGIKKPALTTPVERAILKQGKGAPVKSTDTITINYLGAIYQAKTPFDESYSKNMPLTSALSGLIPGWTTGLTGVRVGSRVMLQIPPAAGYGAQGSGAIPGNATLWFVIDILKAKK